MIRLSVAPVVALSVMLGGCDNPFVESTVLPEPEALMAEYGDLAPGTFALRRYTSGDDPGERFSGQASYRPDDPATYRLVCMRYEGGTAAASSRELAHPTPGLRTSAAISLPTRLEFSEESVLMVHDTTGGRISAVFAARLKASSSPGFGFYVSVIEGGFNASYEDVSCDPLSTERP